MMRPISAEVLAQNLSAQITDAACKGRGAWWSQLEAPVASGASAAVVAKAAQEAFDVCADCPFETHRTCAELAETDGYTGLAAGGVYRDGRRLAVHVNPSGGMSLRAAS